MERNLEYQIWEFLYFPLRIQIEIDLNFFDM
jgi:hypothetical protein